MGAGKEESHGSTYSKSSWDSSLPLFLYKISLFFFLKISSVFIPILHSPSLSLCLCLLLHFSPLSSLCLSYCSATCWSFSPYYLHITFSCREIWFVLSFCHSSFLHYLSQSHNKSLSAPSVQSVQTVDSFPFGEMVGEYWKLITSFVPVVLYHRSRILLFISCND